MNLGLHAEIAHARLKVLDRRRSLRKRHDCVISTAQHANVGGDPRLPLEDDEAIHDEQDLSHGRVITGLIGPGDSAPIEVDPKALVALGPTAGAIREMHRASTHPQKHGLRGLFVLLTDGFLTVGVRVVQVRHDRVDQQLERPPLMAVEPALVDVPPVLVACGLEPGLQLLRRSSSTPCGHSGTDEPVQFTEVVLDPVPVHELEVRVHDFLVDLVVVHGSKTTGSSSK